ncbi:hypothetical protein D3C85_1698410 [compost metagenome]
MVAAERMAQAQMLRVQPLQTEQFSRRDHHLVLEQPLKHSMHIDLAQRAGPDRRATLGIDELQGIAQTLLQQLGHLHFSILE